MLILMLIAEGEAEDIDVKGAFHYGKIQDDINTHMKYLEDLNKFMAKMKCCY